MQTIHTLGLVLLLLTAATGSAHAQVLTANDDTFHVPYGFTLTVDPFGVLDNDILDDENAGETGATATLVTDVSHGTLALASDGSFTYSPGASFEGSDSFVYEAVFGAATSQATVNLSACSGGPQIFTCWKEAAFLALADDAGLPSFQEGFEDDSVWGVARTPIAVPSVSNRGFEWRANDFDSTHLVPPFPPDPPPNQITTGSGPARTGNYGAFDLAHGYAVGSSIGCDVETPTPNCFYHDGIMIARELGSSPLHGVGGYFTSSNGADIAIVIDGDYLNPIGGGGISNGPHQFFGVIDTGPVGFESVQFREVDGRISDTFLIFADDFTILAEPAVPVPAFDRFGLAALAALALVALAWSLRRAGSY